MKLSDHLEPEFVVADVRPGTLEEILEQLVAPLARADAIDDLEAVRDALLARERVLSTGIGNGVAVPHALFPGLEESRLLVGVTRQGIEFGSVDGDPVRVFFVLLSPVDGSGRHIRLLARIARLARHPEFVDAVAAGADGPAVVGAIADWEREHL